MKRKKNLASFTLFTAIMMAATFTACSDDDNSGEHKHFNEDDATLVTNDAELRSAITDGASIQLAIDIDLSNSTLNIAEGITVTITGGTVHASAGEGGTGNRAIGPGKGCDAYGQLTIGDLMMVRSERLAAAEERKNMCWYRTDVHVEPCTHPDYTADTCPYHKH